jgi:hypothetical protein
MGYLSTTMQFSAGNRNMIADFEIESEVTGNILKG